MRNMPYVDSKTVNNFYQLKGYISATVEHFILSFIQVSHVLIYNEFELLFTN